MSEHNTIIEPYLFFDGNCEEALHFYKQKIGAEPCMLMRYSDSPEPLPEGMVPEGYDNKVMHTLFTINGQTVMASDGSRPGGFNGFALAIQVDSETEARRLFDGLSDGASIEMPMGPTFWSPCYGMLTDRFGVQWMVMVPGPEDQQG